MKCLGLPHDEHVVLPIIVKLGVNEMEGGRAGLGRRKVLPKLRQWNYHRRRSVSVCTWQCLDRFGHVLDDLECVN